MSVTYKLKVKNFGPITTGYENPEEDDFFYISRCSVLIGEQGGGKSTIAKITATLLWLEKDFIQKRKDFTKFTAGDLRLLCRNQKIDTYFYYNTYICFESSNFTFIYEDSGFRPCLQEISLIMKAEK